MKNKFLIFGVIIAVLFLALLDSNSNSNTDLTSTASLSPTSSESQNDFENKVQPKNPDEELNSYQVVDDFINALKYYYLASITQPNLSDVEDVNSIYFEMFSTMLEQNRYFKNGNSYLEKYTDSSSEVLNLAANGTLLGANELIEENNVIISIFKNVDAEDVSGSELNFELANYHTKQKEGYSKISLAAPQIGYLIYMPATSDNPTGPIPYRITSQERSDLLDRIENLFGDELSAYEDDIANSAESYNAVIFAVHSIRSNLLHDTYEEASE